MKIIFLTLGLALLVSCQKENVQPVQQQAVTVIENEFQGTWGMLYVYDNISANGNYTYELNDGGDGYYTASVSGSTTTDPITWSSQGDSVLTINATPMTVNWLNDSTIMMQGQTWIKY